MVKIGFIVEGDSEMVFMKNNVAFHNLLKRLSIELVSIVDGEGGELYNSNILNRKKEICKDAGADHIIILTDLDEDPCFTEKKAKLNLDNISFTIIARKAYESWFLADTTAIRLALENNEYYCELPENLAKPFDEVKRLSMLYRNGRGYSSKPLLSKRMNNLGFDIETAAKHDNCSSAKYFVQKLKEISGSS